MNIFALDLNPEQAAQWHVDKHVVKMPLEYAQLLSTAHALVDKVERGYRPTHANHPSALWARSSRPAYQWLYALFSFTAAEYHHRYNRQHKSWVNLQSVLAEPPSAMPDADFVMPFLAMDDEYKLPDGVVLSYRNYYNRAKRDLHVWSKRPKPEWIT